MHLLTQIEIARRAWDETKAEHLPTFDECGGWFQQQKTTDVYDLLMCGNEPQDAFGEKVLELAAEKATAEDAASEVVTAETAGGFDPAAGPGKVVLSDAETGAAEIGKPAEEPVLRTGFEKLKKAIKQK